MRPCLAVVIAIGLATPACRSDSSSSERHVVTASRPVGSWRGTGDQSVGDINSDTGRFHITWETRAETRPGAGTFKLTLRSAVSGRPLQVIVDHKGEGKGEADFADAGRIYDFLIDSHDVEWSFSVVELYLAYEKPRGR